MDKTVIAIVIVLVAVLGAVLIFAGDDSTSGAHRETLNVSSAGPFKLSELIEEIKTKDYYKGYDNETVKWMESLGEKYVWSSHDKLVIMDSKWDSDKIPSIYACDVDFYEIFSCDVLESHSLGSVKYPADVLLVKNVEYIGENAHYYEV
jgi:hypothetical protein